MLAARRQHFEAEEAFLRARHSYVSNGVLISKWQANKLRKAVGSYAPNMPRVGKFDCEREFRLIRSQFFGLDTIPYAERLSKPP